MNITLDTHSLVWSIDKNLNSMLSKKALETIKEAEKTGIVYVPTIALAETLHLIEKGRVKLSFDNLLREIEASNNYEIIPFDIKLLKIAKDIKGLEIHDRLILAASILTDSVLISKDKAIREQEYKVIW